MPFKKGEKFTEEHKRNISESHKRNKGNVSHGMSYTRFYKIYDGARGRCLHKSNAGWKRYGARGIVFTWKNFESFRDDMYQGYLEHLEKYGEKNTTIDRIDNDGNYTKDNCKWSTIFENGQNKSNLHYLEYNGERKTIAGWSRDIGVNQTTIRERVKSNMSMDKVLFPGRLNWHERKL